MTEAEISERTNLIIITAVGVLVLNSLHIWIANAFLKGRKWARIALIILSFSSMVVSLTALAVHRFDIASLIGTVIQGAIFAAVTYSAEVKLFFDENARSRRSW